MNTKYFFVTLLLICSCGRYATFFVHNTTNKNTYYLWHFATSRIDTMLAPGYLERSSANSFKLIAAKEFVESRQMRIDGLEDAGTHVVIFWIDSLTYANYTPKQIEDQNLYKANYVYSIQELKGLDYVFKYPK